MPGALDSIIATRVAANLSQPLYVTAAPNDSSRLFIVEKGGLVKILDLNSGQVLATPFLDVSSQITTLGEQGLLGLAFSPGYAQSGEFHVYLSNPDGDSEIRRYRVSSDPDRADETSAELALRIDMPGNNEATNHRAGWLGFGPDGFLHVAVGDGGLTRQNAQNADLLLGKILRIDVGADAFPMDPTRNYAIPGDNPFVNAPGADEIWALGLRNPWRASFDRLNGDFWIADVGGASWEEVNIGARGANYGWPNTEGSFDPIVHPNFTQPLHAYPHGPTTGGSISGGYVYRGPEEGLQGHYFFGDFSSGRIWTLERHGSAAVAIDRTGEIEPDIGAIGNVSSFGEDATGNLYVVDYSDGEVFRLNPRIIFDNFSHRGSWTPAGHGPERWSTGDFNGDGRDDVFRYLSGSSGADMFLSTGAALNGAGSWTGAGNGAAGWHVGDFNGDGRDDVFRYLPGSSGADMFLSDGARFNRAGSWTGAGNGSLGWLIGDFDGDGRDDIFRSVDGRSGADMFLSTGAGFQGAGSWTSATPGQAPWLVGDFNGDGRDDIARSAAGGSGVETFLSNGSRFQFAGLWTAANAGADGWRIGDYNADGRSDLLRYLPGISGAEVFLSTGSAFSAAGSWTEAGNGAEGWQVGNFDGAGGDDIFRYLPGSSGADMFLT